MRGHPDTATDTGRADTASARLAALHRVRTDLRFHRDRKDEAGAAIAEALPAIIEAIAASEAMWWAAYKNRRSPEWIAAVRGLADSLAALRDSLPPG